MESKIISIKLFEDLISKEDKKLEKRKQKTKNKEQKKIPKSLWDPGVIHVRDAPYVHKWYLIK